MKTLTTERENTDFKTQKKQFFLYMNAKEILFWTEKCVKLERN